MAKYCRLSYAERKRIEQLKKKGLGVREIARALSCSPSTSSWILSYPTLANHLLNGSAFGDGIDWMMRKMPSVLAQFNFCAPPGVSTERGGDNLSPPFSE